MRFLDAGESHGKCLVAIIEGLPSNLELNIDKVNEELKRRQSGYGRGGRMKIETDKAEFLTGVRNNLTLGSPLTVKIENADYKNWENVMNVGDCLDMDTKAVVCPRPGHADLTGVIKYDFCDIRNVLERSSARETAIRTAVGAVSKQLLEKLGITIVSCVDNIGGIKSKVGTFDEMKEADKSCLRVIEKDKEKEMIALIDKIKEDKDTIGGSFVIIVRGVKAGFGSYVEWDRKIDAILTYALMSIQGIKGVEFGLGFEYMNRKGSEVHDEIYYDGGKVVRKTNNAGGIEGGMTNGEDIVIRCVFKPIPTLMKGLDTFNIVTKEKAKASTERSDIVAVSACSVVAENVVAYALCDEILKRLGGDNIKEVGEKWNLLK